MAEKTFFKDMLDTIRQEDLERVIALIEADRERLHATTVFGTWLHFAASEGKLEIVKYFVSQGLDVNECCETVSSLYTAINAAAFGGHLEVVRYMLSCGANIDVSKSNHNPLFTAVQQGHGEVVKLLIESGIDAKIKYNTKTMKNMDAIALAYEWGRSNVVEILRHDSLGEPVFWHDGKYYFSPVLDEQYVQIGWKKFDLQGNRLGLYDSNAKKRVND